MTPAELLALLRQIHNHVSLGIKSLQDRVDNESKYKSAALQELDAQMQASIGSGQLLADLLPDYRALAPAPEEKGGEGE